MSALSALSILQTLITQAPPPDPSPASDVPTWGWVTAVSVLASTVATLAGFYKKARDEQVSAEQSKAVLVEKVGDKTSLLLERAIEAFTLTKTGNEVVANRITQLIDEIQDLKQEVRRVGEKVEK